MACQPRRTIEATNNANEVVPEMEPMDEENPPPLPENPPPPENQPPPPEVAVQMVTEPTVEVNNPPIPMEFALTPALANKDHIAFTGEGSKIFKNGSVRLPVDIDCTADNLQMVLAAVEERAVVFGWLDTILNIDQGNGEFKDLLTQYGEITLAQVRDHASSYIQQSVRAAQDSMMLFSCLTNSLTQEARKKLLLYKSEYYVNDRIPSGALLLKVLIRESYIDTNATVKFVRENLSSLDVYMVKVDSDIEKFNRYVYQNLIKLQSHGKQTLDLMTHLFRGYAKASDKTFVAYMAKKEEDYEEGRDPGYQMLMQLALQKFKILKEGGKWNAPTEAEEKIIALEAEVTKLKAQAVTSKSNNKYFKPKEKPMYSNGSKNGKSNGKKPPPEWMTTKPKDGEPRTKMMSGKEYHWCDNHEAWTRHKPSECKGKGYKFPTTTQPNHNKRKPDDKPKNDDKKKKPKMVALTSMYASSDEE